MTLELKPLGNSCNLGCTYCYQEPMRNAGNVRASSKYDIDLMLDMADKSGRTRQGYTVFGGEGLLVPKKDLEKIFQRSFKKYGKSSIQTNGSLIDSDHVEMFKKYGVSVGISIDGLGEQNSLRKSLSKNITTEELTLKTINGIKLLINNGVNLGIITTLHKLNGTPEQLPKLLDFFTWLKNIGVTNGNVHMLEVDSPEAEKYCLTKEENEQAFLTLAKFFDLEENRSMNYIPFREMQSLLIGDNTNVGCVWSSCDFLDTQAVYGIEGNGQLSNCGMVNKEGIEWTKSENSNTLLRDLILYQTPDEMGGCQGCSYFLLCNGHCVGSGESGDWRNKTVYCSTIKKLFKYYELKMEKQGLIPFSKKSNLEALERIYIERLMNSQRRESIPGLEKIYKELNFGA